MQHDTHHVSRHVDQSRGWVAPPGATRRLRLRKKQQQVLTRSSGKEMVSDEGTQGLASSGFFLSSYAALALMSTLTESDS